jgi:hypothetical protein
MFSRAFCAKLLAAAVMEKSAGAAAGPQGSFLLQMMLSSI